MPGKAHKSQEKMGIPKQFDMTTAEMKPYRRPSPYLLPKEDKRMYAITLWQPYASSIAIHALNADRQRHSLMRGMKL